jgi:hypothetical protein
MKKVWALIIVVLLAWGCSGGTDGNSSVKVTGKVVDESGNPVSGVQVMIYPANKINELEDIRSQAPGVGFDGYEKMLFNASNQNSLGSGMTNTSGNFSVGVNTSSSIVNVGLSKESYGHNFFSSINIQNSSDLTINKDSTLFFIPGFNIYIADDTLLFDKNTTYFLNKIGSFSEIEFLLSSDGILIFKEGAKIVIDEALNIKFSNVKKLLVEGSLTNPVAFLSKNNIPWNKVQFDINGDEVNVNGLACSNGAEGIIFNGSPGIKITNSVFNDIEGGLTFLTNNKIEINNTIISDSEDGYLLSSGVDSSSIENSIFLNNQNPLRIEGQGFDEGQGENPIYSKITNNYIKNSDVAIDAVTVDLSIKNNSIINANIGINVNNGCRGYIENNHISIINQIGINIISLTQNISWGKYPAKFNPPDGYFTNNNIINTNSNIFSFVNDEESNVLCQNNYWGTTNFDTLETIINKRKDV